MTEGKAICTADVGQHQMWLAQYYIFNEPEAACLVGRAGGDGLWLSRGGRGGPWAGRICPSGRSRATADSRCPRKSWRRSASTTSL